MSVYLFFYFFYDTQVPRLTGQHLSDFSFSSAQNRTVLTYGHNQLVDFLNQFQHCWQNHMTPQEQQHTNPK